MAELYNSKTVSISDTGLFDFKRDDGAYTFDFSKNFVQVKVGGGQMTNISDASFASAKSFDFEGVDTLNITGINFHEAGASGAFRTDVSLDAMVSGLLTEYGVSAAVDMLTVNGSKADAFKLIWDHLDNGYSYYNTPVNQAFVELGFKYLDYLNNGGDPLTDVTAKYAADNNNDGIPQRDQSLHDNLLGNLDVGSIRDKFFDGNAANNPKGTAYTGSATQPNEALGNEIIQQLEELGWDRPYYGGYEGEPNNAATWDKANYEGWFI